MRVDFRQGARFTHGDGGTRPVHDTQMKRYRHLNFFQHECELEMPVSFAEPFAVGVYEVTFDEWDAAERDTVGPCLTHHPSDEGWGRGRRPVVNVSVKDAERYAEWLSWRTGQSYRLLREHEWEHAARGGVAAARNWGEGEAEQCRYANGADRSAASRYSGLPVAQCDDGHATTAPVGGYAPNACIAAGMDPVKALGYAASVNQDAGGEGAHRCDPRRRHLLEDGGYLRKGGILAVPGAWACGRFQPERRGCEWAHRRWCRCQCAGSLVGLGL